MSAGGRVVPAGGDTPRQPVPVGGQGPGLATLLLGELGGGGWGRATLWHRVWFNRQPGRQKEWSGSQALTAHPGAAGWAAAERTPEPGLTVEARPDARITRRSPGPRRAALSSPCGLRSASWPSHPSSLPGEAPAPPDSGRPPPRVLQPGSAGSAGACWAPAPVCPGCERQTPAGVHTPRLPAEACVHKLRAAPRAHPGRPHLCRRPRPGARAHTAPPPPRRPRRRLVQPSRLLHSLRCSQRLSKHFRLVYGAGKPVLSPLRLSLQSGERARLHAGPAHAGPAAAPAS